MWAAVGGSVALCVLMIIVLFYNYILYSRRRQEIIYAQQLRGWIVENSDSLPEVLGVDAKDVLSWEHLHKSDDKSERNSIAGINPSIRAVRKTAPERGNSIAQNF